MIDSTVMVLAGKSVQIRFGSVALPNGSADSEVYYDDGSFEIHYDTKEHPNRIVVKETAGLPGSVKGGANEILYEEEFAPTVTEIEPFKGIPTFFDGWQQRMASIYRKEGFRWVSNDNGDVTLRKGDEFVMLMRSEFVYLNGKRVYVGTEPEKAVIIQATPEWNSDFDSTIWACHHYLDGNEEESVAAAKAWRDLIEPPFGLYDWLRDDWTLRNSVKPKADSDFLNKVSLDLARNGLNPVTDWKKIDGQPLEVRFGQNFVVSANIQSRVVVLYVEREVKTF